MDAVRRSDASDTAPLSSGCFLEDEEEGFLDSGGDDFDGAVEVVVGCGERRPLIDSAPAWEEGVSVVDRDCDDGGLPILLLS